MVNKKQIKIESDLKDCDLAVKRFKGEMMNFTLFLMIAIFTALRLKLNIRFKFDVS